MSNLHWCYTFCTGVTLFALVLHLNCIALSQSESSNFFMCIIISVNVFGFEQKKKGAEVSYTSFLKMPDKTLSKETVNLLTSGSASSGTSPEL